MLHSEPDKGFGPIQVWDLADLLTRMICRVELKLREMKVPKYDRRIRERKDLGSMLDLQALLIPLEGDMAEADAHGSQYLREQSKGLVRAEFEKRRGPVLQKLADMMSSWGLAAAIARAVVDHQLQGAKPRGKTTDGKLPLRFFLHVQLSASTLPGEYLFQVVTGLDNGACPGAVLENYGWLQGSVKSADGMSGSVDGVFLIVRSDDGVRAISHFIQWLEALGAGRISSPSMHEVKLVNPLIEQPPLTAASDALETH